MSIGFLKRTIPTIEGFASTTGGAGGTVYTVSNTNDSGSGSLREALEASGTRIINFSTSGVCDLSTAIEVTNGNFTYNGHTSPNGFQVSNNRILLKCSNFIIIGAKWRNGSPVSTNTDQQRSISILADPSAISNGIIAFSSFGFSIKELAAIGTEGLSTHTNLTFAYNIFGYALENAGHSGGANAKGPVFEYNWDNVAFHHNIIYSTVTEGWRIVGNPSESNFDIRNNIIMPCNDEGVGNGQPSLRLNVVGDLVGNTFVYPAAQRARYQEWDDATLTAGNHAKIYASDNKALYQGSFSDVTYGTAFTDTENFTNITTQTAEESFKTVLGAAGSWPRDVIDQRIVDNIAQQVAEHYDDQTDLPAGDWPTYS